MEYKKNIVHKYTIVPQSY